jgi:pantoate--beta-alanine ligase
VERTGELAVLRRRVAAARGEGRRVGFVPTMGALHEGHLSLVREARAECGFVVVSIFVNPTQFAPGEDFERYPRTPEKDADFCQGAGVDLLYAPEARDFYPEGFATSIAVRGVTEGGEGAARPGHFPGVAAAVAKLFLRVLPDRAYFGRKDLQQVAVVRRLIRDLDFPVELVVGETVRDADGLAVSSRNAYLSAEDRRLAIELPKALFAARESVLRGERDPVSLERGVRQALEAKGLKVDYADVVDGVTMRRPERVEPGTALAAAVRVGKTRLIDNVLLMES